MEEKILLNDLPKYSLRMRELLFTLEEHIRYKTSKEVIREYNDDKWGSVWSFIENHPNATLQDVNRYLFDELKEIVVFQKGEYLKKILKSACDNQISIVQSTLQRYMDQANCLVELGAGYGFIILNLIKRMKNDHISYFAGEYTVNGIRSIGAIAENEKIKIEVDSCDFRELTLGQAFAKVRRSVVFTSFALVCVPQISRDFIQYIRRLDPLYCVHFEPCYEHHDPLTIQGLLCRRYIETNDYNRNLASMLHEAEERGELEIISEEKNCFGTNPLLPMSVIVWRPIHAS